MTAHPIKSSREDGLKHAEALGLGTRDYTLIPLCASSFDPGRFCCTNPPSPAGLGSL